MDIQAFKELTRRILLVTDEMEIHREAVSVPLDTEGDGLVRLLPGGKLEIVGPAGGDVDAFIARLPAELEALDLSSVPRADD